MKGPIRAAVVGVGYLGRFHAQKYQSLKGEVELVGVCDLHAPQAEKVAKELNVQVLKIEDLPGKVDIATVATSTQNHFDAAQFLLSNHIAVNVEKPMTATIEQAETLLKTAESKNTLLSVGHIERFSSYVKYFGQRSHDFDFIRLTRKADYKARGADVSVLYDLMIHDIDLVLKWYGPISDMLVMGSKVLSNTWDEVTALLKMRSGRTVQIEVSRVAHEVTRQIYGSGRNGSLLVNTGNGSWRAGKYQLAEPFSQWREGQIAKVDPLLEETKNFVYSFKNHLKPEVPGEAGLAAMKAVEWVDQELAFGKRV
ncbi:MAG TPA: Gfo/Idh/MocA family oxidoreductase [Pseudobdellovibrionaceae bacterium]|nr:Gfo/Idh/MocA family oxidoreductase [Pseudobdellovibrionaceae bacterium]